MPRSASLLLTLALIPSLGNEAPGAEHPPNVLFIAIDDLRPALGCYDDPVAISPNIDRLAARGVTFQRAYCQQAVCSPSRLSMLTGLRPDTIRVWDLNTHFRKAAPDAVTLPQHFRHNGYHTLSIGKIFHGGGEPAKDPPSWSEPPRYDVTREPSLRYALPKNLAGKGLKRAATEAADTPDHTYVDGLVCNEALETLGRLSKAEKPFFLAVGFKKPHVPLKAPQEFFDLYQAEELPLPPDFANEPTLPLGADVRNQRRNLDLYANRSFTAAEARAALHAYYACVSYMDAQLGRVLDALDAGGQTDNTLIVLWGDHGWHLSEKGFFAKGTLFEVAVRAPLIIADPRRQATAGRTCRRIVQFVDIYPTLADLAGLPLPAALEGASLRPLLDDPDTDWDKPALTVQSRGWSRGRRIRTERWAYSQWDDDSAGAMLFDHDADPHELRNLAGDPAFAEIIADLQQRLRNSAIAAK